MPEKSGVDAATILVIKHELNVIGYGTHLLSLSDKLLSGIRRHWNSQIPIVIIYQLSPFAYDSTDIPTVDRDSTLIPPE